MSESREDMESRHRKELKALEGEKRAAVKKAKGRGGKGKKGKEMLAAVEAEYETKLKELKSRHDAEMQSGVAAEAGVEATTTTTTTSTTEEQVQQQQKIEETVDDKTDAEAEDVARKRKQEKARRKREKAREKELEREQRIAKETAEAGPSPRDLENAVILQQLEPLRLKIKEVTADGHCLYRAVAAQCGSDYQDMRNKCADTLMEHEESFSPFCGYTDTVPDFKSYVERVRSSADWGGHLELRALAMALKRPMWIYRAQSKDKLVIEEQGCDRDNPILLSFHLNYYALGEHYNQVVTIEES